MPDLLAIEAIIIGLHCNCAARLDAGGPQQPGSVTTGSVHTPRAAGAAAICRHDDRMQHATLVARSLPAMRVAHPGPAGPGSSILPFHQNARRHPAGAPGPGGRPRGAGGRALPLRPRASPRRPRASPQTPSQRDSGRPPLPPPAKLLAAKLARLPQLARAISYSDPQPALLLQILTDDQDAHMGVRRPTCAAAATGRNTRLPLLLLAGTRPVHGLKTDRPARAPCMA